MQLPVSLPSPGTSLAGLRLQILFCAIRACCHTQSGTFSGFIILKGYGRRTGGSEVCAEGCLSAGAGAVADGDRASGGAGAAGEGAQACPPDGSLAGAEAVVFPSAYPKLGQAPLPEGPSGASHNGGRPLFRPSWPAPSA
jgi:hypothetical protein